MDFSFPVIQAGRSDYRIEVRAFMNNEELVQKAYEAIQKSMKLSEASSDKEFKGDGLLVTDYFCFDKPIVAPASGTVVAVVNTVEDNELN